MNAAIYSVPKVVTAQAIDERDHVNNLHYMLWCLEAAEAHWEYLASPQIKEQYIWYVLHHSIDYKAAAFLGESLEVQTWVEQLVGAKCYRHYKIIRVKDQKTLIEAKTVWCLIDAKSLKPAIIPEEICTLF